MPIQLVIRQKAEGTEGHFAVGRLAAFTTGPLRLGSASGNDCLLPASDLVPAKAGTLDQEPVSGAWFLLPEPGSVLTVNQVAATGRTALNSGDEIGCGPWNIHFHKSYPPASFAWRADLLAVLAKVLLVLILLTEVALVTWLPQRLNQSRLWELAISRQRATLLLDELRLKQAAAKPRNDLEQAAYKMIGDQLDLMAVYLRRYQERLDREQWRRVQEDLDGCRLIQEKLKDGSAFPPIPSLDLDGAVRAETDGK